MKYLVYISFVLVLSSVYSTNLAPPKQDIVLFVDQKEANLVAFMMHIVRFSHRIAMIGFRFKSIQNRNAIRDFVSSIGIDLIDKLYFIENPHQVIEPNESAETFSSRLSNLGTSNHRLQIVCLADIADFMEIVQDKVQFHPGIFSAIYALLSPDIESSDMDVDTSISQKYKKKWHLIGVRVVLIPSQHYEESLDGFVSTLKKRIEEGLVLPGTPSLFADSDLFDPTENPAQSVALLLVAVLLTGADQDCQSLHQFSQKASFLQTVHALGGERSTACILNFPSVEILDDALLLSLETFKFLPVNGVYPQKQLDTLERNYNEQLNILQTNVDILQQLQMRITELGTHTLSGDGKHYYHLAQARSKKLREALMETERVMRSGNALNVIKSVTKLAEINRNIRAQKEKKLLQLKQKLDDLTHASDLADFTGHWDKMQAKAEEKSRLEDEGIGSSHHAEF
uniref:AlNc14C79G5218 protein n=1 Tax=Albugo laibachii Nc14 TaxID=890382 RepID=F0WF24_9STRA|nr:AlNc14C79G5218 [Albugo laibachii Nc14]|eukprot:CCA19806.1 AlNc14C79G5218 [Albugo laibachii Nc14]